MKNRYVEIPRQGARDAGDLDAGPGMGIAAIRGVYHSRFSDGCRRIVKMQRDEHGGTISEGRCGVRSKLTEPSLRVAAEAGVIACAVVVEGDDGYRVGVRFVHDPEVIHLIHGQRGKPRVWASLDRLWRHLAEVAPTVERLEVWRVPPAGWPA